MKGHDFTWYNNYFHDTAQHNIDGSKASGWYWTAGAENYIDTNGMWVNPANLSFIDNKVRRTGGEGLILSRCTSGLAIGNEIFNCLSVQLYWQNGINLTIKDNIVGCDEHRFFQVWPNARPAAIMGAIESWDDRVPTRPTTDVVIVNNVIDAGDNMIDNPILWRSRSRDGDEANNTYGGLIIKDNVVVGTPRKDDVVIDKLDDPQNAPGPINVLRHGGPIFIGDPDLWEILQ